MRKILLSIVICLAASFIASSQSILGRWSSEMSDESVTMSVGFNFENGGRVALFMNGHVKTDETITIYLHALVTGKYEFKGKTLGIRFNNDAKSGAEIKISGSVSQSKRNEIEQNFKIYAPDLESEMLAKLEEVYVRDYYRQVIQVNEEKLILKFPGYDTETFYRMK